MQASTSLTVTTTERPLDFLYDPISQTSSVRSYHKSAVKAHAQPQQLKYVPVYPHMFGGMPHFANGYYAFRDNFSYPYHMDPGYPKPPNPPEINLAETVRGRDRWESYKRPHLPYYDGPIQYLEHQYPVVRKNCDLPTSTEPYGRSLEEPETRSTACQTDYRVQSAQTDPAELGVKLREAFNDFNTIYPKHCHPFTIKTMALVKRGLHRRRLREYFATDHSRDDPTEQMKQFAQLEAEKWEFLGAEMQENMEDRMTAFKKSIADSQNYLQSRIAQAKVTLEENQAAKFSAQMAVMWYDVNIWRRYYAWTKQFTKRRIAEWQINPPDVELLKQVPEVFAHDARRYVPRTSQGDMVSDLRWKNRSDYFLDTWEGFSQVLQDMDPKRLQANIYLPVEESMYGAKGYVKRKFKEAARFEKISFTFDDADFGDSASDLGRPNRTKKKQPMLLRPMPLPKGQKPMLRVPKMDSERQATYRAGVTIQKLVRGRGMQKMIQTGVVLRRELIDEVRGNVALTDKAKTDMKNRYEELLRKGRVLLFYRYRARFVDSFLSTIEAQLGTRVLRDSHYTLVRQLEFEKVQRLARFASQQRRMREAKEAGRRQQEFRRYAEQEASVQLFQLNHHKPAERAVTHAVVSAEAHMARMAARAEEKIVWQDLLHAEKSMQSAMNQQEKETFIASMIYSVMIPDVQRTLIREKQNVATESRRLAIHQTLFGSISQLNRTLKRRRAGYSNDQEDQCSEKAQMPPMARNILPRIVRPSHRLDSPGKPYRKYVIRRKGLMRSMDTQYNFCAETQLRTPISNMFVARLKARTGGESTEIGLARFQAVMERVMDKAGGCSGIRQRSLLKPRRRPSYRRFDRVDQSTLRRIDGDKRAALTRSRQEDLAEIFEERPTDSSLASYAEAGRQRRKRARVKAAHVWTETHDWIQSKVNFHRQNRIRPFDLDPLQHDFQSPRAEVTGESISKCEIVDLAKRPAVTLTVHTTGDPVDEVDDVVVVNELVQTNYVPRVLPEDEYMRSRIKNGSYQDNIVFDPSPCRTASDLTMLLPHHRCWNAVAGMPHKIQKLCVIRDVEYLISLSFGESAQERDVFVMEATDKSTQCSWRGVFDSDTITRLTTQAGSLKAFAAFTAMVKAAIFRTAKSVSLDLITPDSLAKRAGKSREALSKQPEADPQRLYIVLTHRTEFEECSYPLPLDLRTPGRLPAAKNRVEVPHIQAGDDFDDQKIAFVEFQIEVKHLRKENEKLREALIEQRSSRKEFEQRLVKDKDHLLRSLEQQMLSDRKGFQKDMQHQSRQTEILTKNLTLAKRENDSLRIQVRRLQAENAVYKRSLTIRPNQLAPSRSHTTSLPKKSDTGIGKSRSDPRGVGTSQSKMYRRKPSLERSISPVYWRSNADRSKYQGKSTQHHPAPPQRYRSADYLERQAQPRVDVNLQRSRSYSPRAIPAHRKRAFSIVKALCPSESLLSETSRCSSPEFQRPLPTDQSFIRESRYRRREPIYRSPARPLSHSGSDIASRVSNESVAFNRTKPYSRERFLSPPLRRRDCRSPRQQAQPNQGSPARNSRTNSEDRSGEKGGESHGCDVRNGKYEGNRSRSVSPVERLVRKYKEGRSTTVAPATKSVSQPDMKRRTSLNGPKFRELLARLQGLGEEFPDSLADTPR